MKPPKTAGVFDEAAFEALLAYLDPNRERAGEKYDALWRKVVQMLAWRGSWRPEELADEAMSRVGRSLYAGETMRSLEGYSAGIARLLALEDMRRQRHVPLPEEYADTAVLKAPALDDARSLAFDDCLLRLPAYDRDLILQYYGGDRHEKIRSRKALAQKLGLPLNALRIRAYRIRVALQQCINRKVPDAGGRP